MTGQFLIFAMMREDVHQGVVWLVAPGAPARGIVKIKNDASGQTVHCEAMQIEDNFLDAYNQGRRMRIDPQRPSLVMGYWHRDKLGGIETKKEALLTISPANSWWGKLMACLDHPQTVVRVATWLGAIGLALGVVGGVAGVVPYLWPPSAAASAPTPVALTKSQVADLLLYAELKDGAISGKVFNRLPSYIVTSIVVEAVPKDEKNPFNSFGPRFIEIPLTAQPRAMSAPFVAETGPLNPEFHTLRIASGQGFKR